MKELIAYQGPVYTIEWYYNSGGQSEALEYFYNMSDAQKRKALMLFKRMGDFGKIVDKTKFRYEGNEIFAFKPQPDRFLSFFVKGKKIIVTSGFLKKSDKLPEQEKLRAILCKKDYLTRVEKGIYYDKK